MVQVYQLGLSRKKNFLGGLSINSLLIFINVIFFIVFTILISRYSWFIDYIALKPENIFQGKFLWTFLTSMFMHGSFFHIFANMLSLFFVGSLTQRILGQKRYLYFYLISGLVAGLFFVLISFLFKPDIACSLINSDFPDYCAYAVGASGALFGLVGFLMIITPNLPVYVMFIPIPIKMKYAAPGILILLWMISVSAGLGIGNTAHLGGLVSGLIYGFYLKKKYKNKTKMIQRHFS